MGFKEWIIPQEKLFFDLFDEEVENIVEGAKLLKEFAKDFKERKRFMNKIHRVENKCDKVVHKIYRELDMTFITPFDRDDISGLAGSLDDVIDTMDATMKRIYIYDVKEKPSSFNGFVESIYQAVINLENAVKGLRNLKDIKGIEKSCIMVNKFENDADDLLTKCLRDLFKKDDVKQILKEKEIYDLLEMTTDKLEEVAFLVIDIVLKNS